MQISVIIPGYYFYSCVCTLVKVLILLKLQGRTLSFSSGLSKVGSYSALSVHRRLVIPSPQTNTRKENEVQRESRSNEDKKRHILKLSVTMHDTPGKFFSNVTISMPKIPWKLCTTPLVVAGWPGKVYAAALSQLSAWIASAKYLSSANFSKISSKKKSLLHLTLSGQLESAA